MKINLITYLTIVSISFLNAQNDTLKMNLQECVEYALKNSMSLKSTSLEQAISKAKVGEVRSIGLPQIEANAGVQHNLRLRDIYGQGNGEPSLFANGTIIPRGQVYRVNNFFQLPDALDGNISVSQILFSGSYIVGLQAAKTYQELSTKTVEDSTIKLKSKITKAYYLNIINKERLTLFDKNINRLDSSLKSLRASYKQGFVEGIDVDRMEVAYNNLLVEKQKNENLIALGILMLKFQMGLDLNTPLILKDKMSDIDLDTTNFSSSNFDVTNRIEYKKMLVQKRLAELNNKNTRWSTLPSVNISANLGVFTQSNSLGNLFSGNSFVDQSNRSRWSTYGLIQLGAKIPIFAGFQKKYKLEQGKVALNQIDYGMETLKRGFELQAKSSEVSFKNSIVSMKSQKRNLELAERVASVTRKKQSQGMSSNLEITTAESSLKEAQINYYNTLFDAITSKVDYDLAVGNIK